MYSKSLPQTPGNLPVLNQVPNCCIEWHSLPFQFVFSSVSRFGKTDCNLWSEQFIYWQTSTMCSCWFKKEEVISVVVVGIAGHCGLVKPLFIWIYVAWGCVWFIYIKYIAYRISHLYCDYTVNWALNIMTVSPHRFFFFFLSASLFPSFSVSPSLFPCPSVCLSVLSR